MATTVDLMVSRIGPVETLLLLIYHIGQIRETIKSAMAATVIEKKRFK